MKLPKTFTLLSFFFCFIFIVESLILSSSKSLWRDEAFSYLLSHHPFLKIISLTAGDFTPPFYYFILHIWESLVGNHDVILRLLNLIFSLTLVFILMHISKYMLAEFFKNISADDDNDTNSFRFISQYLRKSWLLSSFIRSFYIPKIESKVLSLKYILLTLLSFYLITFHPGFIYLSTELRPYSLFHLISVFTVLMMFYVFHTLKQEEFLKKIDRKVISIYFAFIGISSLMVYIHSTAILWLATLGLCLFVAVLIQKKIRPILFVIASGIGILILTLPWVLVLIKQAGNAESSFWMQFSLQTAFWEFMGFFSGKEGTRHEPMYQYFLYYSVALTLIGFGVSWKNFKETRFLLGASILILFVISLYSYFFSQIFYQRYLSFLGPVMILLIILAFAKLLFWSKWLFIGVLFPYLFLHQYVYQDLFQHLSPTHYKELRKISSDFRLYTNEVLDIMPCLYYQKSCLYVGDPKLANRFIGVTQLGDIPYVLDWQKISESQIAVISRLSWQDFQMNSNLKNYILLDTKDLGDQVRIYYLQKFE